MNVVGIPTPQRSCSESQVAALLNLWVLTREGVVSVVRGFRDHSTFTSTTNHIRAARIS